MTIRVQLLCGDRTPKIWEGKNRPKLGAISGNFRLGSLGNGSRYRQAENGVINYNPSHIRRGKLWSTNNKVYAANVYLYPKSTLHILC